jgi:hypothetical protein
MQQPRRDSLAVPTVAVLAELAVILGLETLHIPRAPVDTTDERVLDAGVPENEEADEEEDKEGNESSRMLVGWRESDGTLLLTRPCCRESSMPVNVIRSHSVMVQPTTNLFITSFELQMSSLILL